MSYVLPKEVKDLADSLVSLPGIGPKMANRLAVYMSGKHMQDAERLNSSLSKLVTNIGTCEITGNITSKGTRCPIYEDNARDRTKLMVVESSIDLMQIEESGGYDGLYIVLGGLVSPLNGISPDDLNINLLQSMLEIEDISEVILSLNSTVEGEATSLYIKNIIGQEDAEITVSRLARGLPAGAAVEFLDPDTIKSALNSRTNY